jgi:hypothetical protein
MDGNDLANPVKHSYGEEFFTAGGFTKRELIAAMAMQGLLARPEEGRQFPIHINVAEAIAYADELINQLSKNPIAEGLNLLPVHSRELDERAKDDN